MDDRLTRAKYYRDQAAKFRQFAKQEDNSANRDALIELAESFDRLCNKLIDDAAKIGI